MSEFSNRFRQLKDESNLTLKDLSETLDITAPNLSYYMKGREPSYDILIKIADYFNVTTDWLIGRSDERNISQSSIIEEIEKQLQSQYNKDKLQGTKKELYLSNQELFYKILSEIYFFYQINLDLDLLKEFNSYFDIFFKSLKYYFETVNHFIVLPISYSNSQLVANSLTNARIATDIMASSLRMALHDYTRQSVELDKNSFSEDEYKKITTLFEVIFINQQIHSSTDELKQSLERLLNSWYTLS